MGIVNPLGYLLNDAPGSRMSLPRGPVGGGAFRDSGSHRHRCGISWEVVEGSPGGGELLAPPSGFWRQGAKRNRVDRVITLFSHPPNPVDLAEPCWPSLCMEQPLHAWCAQYCTFSSRTLLHFQPRARVYPCARAVQYITARTMHVAAAPYKGWATGFG